jgi:hypothetical protein
LCLVNLENLNSHFADGKSKKGKVVPVLN